MDEKMIKKATEIYKNLEDGKFAPNDFTEFLEIFVWIANQSLYAQDELYDWNKAIQFQIKDFINFWFKGENDKLYMGIGEVNNPIIKVEMSKRTFIGIISGKITNLGLLTYRLIKTTEITGSRMEAQIFLHINAIVLEEIRDMVNM